MMLVYFRMLGCINSGGGKVMASESDLTWKYVLIGFASVDFIAKYFKHEGTKKK